MAILADYENLQATLRTSTEALVVAAGAWLLPS
jgi:hypothetical protein